MICPICNCECASADLHIELNEQGDKAWRGGVPVKLTPQQAEAAFVVAQRQGAFASVEEIMRGMYGRRWEDFDTEGLPTLFSRIRHRIRPLGVKLLAARNHGYALRLANGCYCVRERVAPPVEAKQKRRVQMRKWEGAILRRVAAMLNEGLVPSQIAKRIGETKGSVTGGIQRNRAEIAELRAHEARQSMGNRPRDVLSLPVETRLERG